MRPSTDLRKPFVKFEVRPVEDRTRSLLEGKFMTKDVDFIVLVPHGSEGKLVVERPYEDWVREVRPQTGAIHTPGGVSDTPLMAETRFPTEWVDQIEAGYKAWKEGREMPVEGTPLANWPVISPAVLANCQALHIRTVEELAGADDQAISRLGMGGVTLQSRAQDWVKMNGGETAKATAEMEKLRVQNAALLARIEALEGKREKSEEEL